MTDEHRTRFSDASWYDPSFEVTIGGAGSIGSWLTLFLARIGFPIYLYEMDRVEALNIGGQLYGKSDIGSTKQEAIRKTVANLAMHEDVESLGEYEAGAMVTPICFTCFDNMHSREAMFDKWEEVTKGSERLSLFVDGRLTAESFQMYIVIPGREEAYRKTLFEDDEVEDLPCSYKSTSHIAAMLASQMTTALTNAIHNFKIGNHRDIPFETRFEASMYLYEQQFDAEEV